MTLSYIARLRLCARRETQRATLLAFAIGMTVGGTAAAQTGNAGRDDADPIAPSVELGEITVNARRQTELPREVPFGLSITDGRDIEERRLRDIQSVLDATPGAAVRSDGGTNGTNLFIRGVGTLNQVSADDQSVGVYVDGVKRSSGDVSLSTLDAERVEVLKGPQGTLFGGNSQAGLVNVTSRRPTWRPEGYIRGEFGEQDRRLVEGAFGGPIADQLAGRLALRYNAFDNWVDNSIDNRPLTEPEDFAGRGSLLWRPGANTEVLAIVAGENSDDRVSYLDIFPSGDDPAIPFTPGVFDDNFRESRRYSVQVDHDLAHSRITSITGYTTSTARADVGFGRDLSEASGFGPIDNIERRDLDRDEITQELRWGSLPEADVFWLVGLFTAHANREIDAERVSRQEREFEDDSYAVFGETTVPVSDTVDLTGGLRYTVVEKDYDARYFGGAEPISDRRSLDDKFLTGRVAISYALQSQTNLYALTSFGHKPPGFNDFAIQRSGSEPYDESEIVTYETGIKFEADDGRTGADIAVFFNDISDDHLLTFDNRTFAVETINADTKTYGVEAAGNWSPIAGLRLDAALTYLRAEITSDSFGLSSGDVAAGNDVPNVANIEAQTSVSYTRAVPSFLGLDTPALNARLDYRRVGSRPADPQNNFDLDAYDRLDAHLGLMVGQGEVYLWGDNLTDEQYATYGYFGGPGLRYGAPARGRTLGVGFRYDL